MKASQEYYCKGTLVVAIVHCLMESGVNKFDDLSGASEAAKLPPEDPDRQYAMHGALQTSQATGLP